MVIFSVVLNMLLRNVVLPIAVLFAIGVFLLVVWILLGLYVC